MNLLIHEKIQQFVAEKKTKEEMFEELKKYLPKATAPQIRGYINFHAKSEEKKSSKKTNTSTAGKTVEASEIKFSENKAEITVKVPVGKKITPEGLMKANNLDPKSFKVISFTQNEWDAQAKGGKKVTMQQFKLTVQATETAAMQKSIDEVLEGLTFKNLPKPPALATPTKKSGSDILEINIPDLHFGLHATKGTTGSVYNKSIAREALLDSIRKIKQEEESAEFKKVQLAFLGDFLHVNNTNQTTLAGTFQQIDGDINEIYRDGIRLLVDTITLVSELWKCPIDIVYTRGNHDTDVTTVIFYCLSHLYRQNKNITFDGGKQEITANPHKCVLQNGIPVIYTHGDFPKNNRPNLFWSMFEPQMKAAVDGAKPQMRAGHLHNLNAETLGIATATICHSLCGSSAWEHKNAYSSPRGLDYFVYTKRNTMRGGVIYR